MLLTRAALSVLVALLAGCATTQEVTLGKLNYDKRISSVAQVLDEDNSPQMNANLAAALQREGIASKSPLPMGTKTAEAAT